MYMIQGSGGKVGIRWLMTSLDGPTAGSPSCCRLTNRPCMAPDLYLIRGNGIQYSRAIIFIPSLPIPKGVRWYRIGLKKETTS